MGEWIGRGRKARRAYGFDEIALVPGTKTIDPEDTDCSWQLGDRKIELPIVAAAMDGVVSPSFAIAMSKLGGLAILNLEGVWTRYDDPSDILQEIANATPERATELVQKLYQPEVREDLIGRRIEEIKSAGGTAIVSSIPMKAERFGELSVEAGVDFFVVQGTVVSKYHQATNYKSVDLEAFCKKMPVPVIVGNCVTYETCLDLMSCNPDGILVGIGPGAACTTRGVLGLGVPQVTATVDCSAARDYYYKRTGRYIPIITDGGMSVGGEICKALASGSDAVVIGSAFAKAKEAPGGGFHWGMATPHRHLPRGTRIKVGTTGTLEQILLGPAHLDDGSQNLIGAIKTCMGNVGAPTLHDFQMTDIVIAPAIKTEGKVFQAAQNIGMAKKG
ncbi:GuaB3 family IMP dehydrogenase-related protein [Candidatus Sumerlaeota bacterium]|nr:GuaB3 family IMP dehydrogenase-related protein [Candidatus Sumerlaeota bacterium]